MEHGTVLPIAYHSRGLPEAKQNYTQIDKEGLAVIDGLKKFYQYLWSRMFNVVTDHKPLL